MVNDKVLVTGSSGFIGQHLCRHLTALGYEVLGIDKEVRADDQEGWSAAVVDLLDPQALHNVVMNFAPRLLIHLAARTDLNETRDIAGYAANTTGVSNLIDAVRGTHGVVRRCVFTSSQLVCRVGHVPKTPDEYCPDTLYGQSKVLTEKIVHEKDGGSTEWCLVRPTTVWGPGMSPHYQRLFKLIANRRYFHVGKRQLWKSYSYVGNIVHQYAQLLVAPAAQIHRRTFYLADYAPLSLRDWTNAIQRQLGAPEIPTLPYPVAKGLALIGDGFNALGFSRFPFNSFRLRNILTEYQFDLSDTQLVCGPLPYTVDQGVEELGKWIWQERIL